MDTEKIKSILTNKYVKGILIFFLAFNIGAVGSQESSKRATTLRLKLDDTKKIISMQEQDINDKNLKIEELESKVKELEEQLEKEK